MKKATLGKHKVNYKSINNNKLASAVLKTLHNFNKRKPQTYKDYLHLLQFRTNSYISKYLHDIFFK